MAASYKTLDGSRTHNWEQYTNLQTGILANGTTFWILNGCGMDVEDPTRATVQIGFDINGAKKPNIMGEDFFHFSVYCNGKIVIVKDENLTLGCNKNGSAIYNGYSCSSYIIQNGNMNYLRE